MKRGRLALVLTVTAGLLVTSLSPGCQDPTQVTIEVTLDPRLSCAEIAPGTILVVGSDAVQVEADILAGAVTAKTNRCDDTKKEIGTLVVVPGATQGAAVTVLVGYDRDPERCKPPLYEGCFVARRRFTFVEHTPVRLPIQLDADCKGVVCDAFSTCARGLCFGSDVTCPDGNCTEPGELPDGAPHGDAVTPDAPQPGDGATDGGGIEPPIPCGDGILSCLGPDGIRCGNAMCCRATEAVGIPQCLPPSLCRGPIFCCEEADCPQAHTCEFGGPIAQTVGTCTVWPARCSAQNELLCPNAPCSNDQLSCCTRTTLIQGEAPPAGVCQGSCLMSEARRCCTDSDCGPSGAGSSCENAGGPNGIAGICAP